jgi:predicted N-formylglutamate amidohydrolase
LPGAEQNVFQLMRTLIVTCEHAGNNIPGEYKSLFKNQDEIISSHRGWDPGALAVAEFISKKTGSTLFKNLTTRLLIEPNRSVASDQLYSEFTNSLNEADKKFLLDNYYYSYRNNVEEEVSAKIPVLHLSIHSFTPVLNGVTRITDIGILFDSDRKEELDFSIEFKNKISNKLGDLNIQFNEPYKGTDDGFTTHLRQKFSGQQYVGIEIEINQKLVATESLVRIQNAIAETLTL